MWFRTKTLRRIFGLREMKCIVLVNIKNIILYALTFYFYSNLVKKDEMGWAYNMHQIIKVCIQILV
jgi:hypothetical protein